jgi:hypothetical protein
LRVEGSWSMLARMLRFSMITLVLPFLAACGGAVTSPGESPPAVDGGGAGGDGGVHPLSCTTLSVAGPVQQVSDGIPMNLMLTSLAAGSGGVLVGWSSLLRDPPATFHVRQLGYDAVPSAAGVQLLAGEGSVAQGFGQAAAVSGTGPCVFQGLTGAGGLSGSSVQVASTSCELFRATPSGYALVAGSSQTTGPTLVSLDGSGHAASPSPLNTKGDAGAWGALPDQSFVVASVVPLLDDCVCPTEFYVQHFSASGQPLAPPQRAGMTWPDSSIGIAAMGLSHVLVASTPGDGSRLGLQVFDPDGNAQGAQVPLVSVDAGGPFGTRAVQIAALTADVALVAWVDTSGSNEGNVVVQAVSSTGSPLSAPISVPNAPGTHLRIVATLGPGAIVAWDTPSGGPVNAVPIRCAD